MFDMTRCPQTEAEALDWFYAGIGRTIGSDASDWELVMTNCGLPPGYGPGVIPNAQMPYFAFTQQYSGGPKGRIFLPTDRPDELGYYTRCIQYLDDAAGTYSTQAKAAAKSKKKVPEVDFQKASKSGGLVWAWYWVAGHEYAPVQGATDGGGTGGEIPPPTYVGMTEEQVQAMINAAIAPINEQLAKAVKLGDKIALRTNSGLLSGIKGGGPTVADAPINWIGKTGDAHAWESLTIEKGE